MGYKFVVDYYYVEEVVAFSSEFGHGGFVHPTGSKLYSVAPKTRVKMLFWVHDTLTAFVVLEGNYEGKVLWVEKNKVMRKYK